MTSSKKFAVTIPPDPNPLYTTRVYMMQMGRMEIFKVGISSNVANREHAMATGNPLIVCRWASVWMDRDDALAVENAFHRKYSEYRASGAYQREWFTFNEYAANKAQGELATECLRRRTKMEVREAELALIDPRSYQVVGDIPEHYKTARQFILDIKLSLSEVSAIALSRVASRLSRERNVAVAEVAITTSRRKDGTYGTATTKAYSETMLEVAIGEILRVQRYAGPTLVK